MNLRVAQCDFLKAILMNAEVFYVVVPCRLVRVFIFTDASEEHTVGHVTTNDATAKEC